jgi:hypothetical protein
VRRTRSHRSVKDWTPKLSKCLSVRPTHSHSVSPKPFRLIKFSISVQPTWIVSESPMCYTASSCTSRCHQFASIGATDSKWVYISSESVRLKFLKLFELAPHSCRRQVSGQSPLCLARPHRWILPPSTGISPSVAAVEDLRQVRVKSDSLVLQLLIQCTRVFAMIHATVCKHSIPYTNSID